MDLVVATWALVVVGVLGLIVAPIVNRRSDLRKEKMSVLRTLARHDFDLGQRVTDEWSRALHDSTTIFNDEEISRLKVDLTDKLAVASSLGQLDWQPETGKWKLNGAQWSLCAKAHRRLLLAMARKLKVKDVNSIVEVYLPAHIDLREQQIDSALKAFNASQPKQIELLTKSVEIQGEMLSRMPPRPAQSTPADPVTATG